MYCVKKSLLGLILAGYIGSAAAVGPGSLGTLTGAPVVIGNYISAGGLFSDLYTFTLDSPSSTIGTAISFKLNTPLYPGPEFKIKNFMVALLDATGTITYDSDEKTVKASLLPGNYQFIVSGKVTGTFGGVYGGALVATPITSPVPEANNYTMVLAGLGLVGFAIARRRL